MTGVRATLSNGMVSPIFRTQTDQNGPVLLSIGENSRVKYAGIRSDGDGVYGLKFTDQKGEEIDSWSGDGKQTWREVEVPDDQWLVGIYGLSCYGGTGIQNFGFIASNK